MLYIYIYKLKRVLYVYVVNGKYTLYIYIAVYCIGVQLECNQLQYKLELTVILRSEPGTM